MRCPLPWPNEGTQVMTDQELRELCVAIHREKLTHLTRADAMCVLGSLLREVVNSHKKTRRVLEAVITEMEVALDPNSIRDGKQQRH
jgi:hypothetical protein